MAAQNFKIKNGLSVGSTEVIDSSGDLTNAAFGTAALEAIDDQVNSLLTAGSGITLSYDDSAGTLTITRDAEVGDIEGVTAGDGLSGGGTSGTVSLALDLNELTAATVDVASDSIPFIDGTATRKESIADLVSGMAGTNLTASSGTLGIADSVIRGKLSASGDISYDSSTGVISFTNDAGDIEGVTAGDGLSGGGTSGTVSLALDLNELTAATVDVTADSIPFIDGTATRKESIADLVSAMAGTNISATNGTLGISDSVIRGKISAGGDLSYDSSTGVISFTNDAGDIESVTAGDGLTGGGTSGAVTLMLASSVAGTNLSHSSGVLSVEQKLNNTTAPYYHNVVVTVSGGKFLFDGQTSSQALRLMPSIVYRFDQSDSSNGSHPLQFSESSDGTEMSDGYTIYNKVGTAGSSGAYVEVAFDQEAPSIMYFKCANHSGMGNSVYLGDESGDIAGVTAGDGLSGGGTSGTVTLSLDSSVAGDGLAHSSGVLSLDANELTAATIDPASDSVIIIDASDSNATRKEALADIVTMQAGDGLTASSGAFNVSVDDSSIETSSDALRVKASGITNAMLAGSIANSKLINDSVTVTAGDGLSGGGEVDLGSSVSLAVQVDDSSIETSSDTLQVKAGGITNAMLAGSIANAKLANSAITINSNSTSLGSSVTLDTGDIAENGNLYFTNERVDDRVASLIVGGSNITATYDDAAGTLTLAGSAAYTDGDARTAISVTDSGGDGSLAYNNSTGVITYNGPSASEVRAHISGGTGVSVSSGEIAIGQAVATNSNVQFANLTLSGNLTVNGATTTVSSTNSVIADTLIELGNGTSGSPANDAGLVIERGSSDNVFIGWDESADAITFGTGSFTGASTGNLSLTAAAVNTGALTITNATNSGGTARNVYQSTSAPSSSDGAVGDLWILYS